MNENCRIKRNLDCLYELLAPQSTIGKISFTTSLIKERNKTYVLARNLDIAKFGTEQEDQKICFISG